MYYSEICSKCGGKTAEDMVGRKWCPTCVGRQMAKYVCGKLKLDFGLKSKGAR